MSITTTLQVNRNDYEVVVSDTSIYVVRHEDEIEFEFDSTGSETVEDIKRLIDTWEYQTTENAWESYLSDYYSR